MIAALIFRIALSFFGTLHLDQGTFIAWSNVLVEKGFARFYEGWSDYLPGYLYILWLLGKIKNAVPIPTEVLYKLPAIVADICTGYLIYQIVRRIKNDDKWALVASFLYLFNPAIISNSTFWGQVDSLTALFSLLAIFLIEKNFLFSALALAIGTLIKPQAGIVSLVVLTIALRHKWSLKKIILYGLVASTIFIGGFLPFSGNQNVFTFIFERLKVTFNQYPYTTINAFNFWGLWGLWGDEKKGLLNLGLVGIFISLLLSFLTLLKNKLTESKYLSLVIVFASSFLFLTRIHERHLLPLLAPLSIVSSINPILWISYLGFSLTYILNLYFSYNWITRNFLTVFSQTQINLLIFVNLISLTLCLLEVFIPGKTKTILLLIKDGFNKNLPKSSFTGFAETKISKKAAAILLGAIIVFALLSRILFLWSPKNEYFDEVYHAFTARRVLHADPKAWEWWNTPPEGFAYEWTHPPVAKLGMVLGMLTLGENSLGWRVPAAILGVGVIILIFLIANYLFNDYLLALFSALIFSLDGLPLVMSRIGMNDTYFLFFTLLSIYLFLKNKNFFSALFFGLAAASKWSAIWAIPIFLISHIVLKKEFKISYAWFLIVPPLVYLASYSVMFLTGHDFNSFIEVQKQMWWYHTGLKATHPYTSQWWSWPFLVRPIWLYTSGEIDSFVANIYAMGNPIVFWLGTATILINLVTSFIEGNKKLALVIFSYLIFFVPWAISPRIMFLYHYLPSLPFLAISIAYFLRRYPNFRISFFVVSTFVFLYFYPHWTGLPIPSWLNESYYWFSSWR